MFLNFNRLNNYPQKVKSRDKWFFQSDGPFRGCIQSCNNTFAVHLGSYPLRQYCIPVWREPLSVQSLDKEIDHLISLIDELNAKSSRDELVGFEILCGTMLLWASVSSLLYFFINIFYLFVNCISTLLKLNYFALLNYLITFYYCCIVLNKNWNSTKNHFKTKWAELRRSKLVTFYD